MEGSEIRVDPAGIRDFGAHFRDEVDRDLRPEGDHIVGTFSWGVPFGLRSASGEVQDAATAYHACLESMVHLSSVYIRNAEVLIEVAEKISTSYESADLRSAAGMQKVFSAASAQVTRAFEQNERLRLESEQRAAESEADFMRRHGSGRA